MNPVGGGGRYSFIYFSAQGRAAGTGYHVQNSDSGTGYHSCKNRLHERLHILSFLTPKGRFRPLTLNERDSNRLDGNISTFSIDFLQISFAGQNFV